RTDKAGRAAGPISLRLSGCPSWGLAGPIGGMEERIHHVPTPVALGVFQVRGRKPTATSAGAAAASAGRRAEAAAVGGGLGTPAGEAVRPRGGGAATGASARAGPACGGARAGDRLSPGRRSEIGSAGTRGV